MSRRLRPMHVPIALAAGAAVGGTGVTLYGLAPIVTAPGYIVSAVLFAPVVFIAAFVVWAVGLLVIGGPAWIILARSGRTAPSHALLLGLIATFIVWVVVTLALSTNTMMSNEGGRYLIRDGWRTPYGWFILLKDAVLLSLLGGMVGTVIWWIAYPKDRADG